MSQPQSFVTPESVFGPRSRWYYIAELRERLIDEEYEFKMCDGELFQLAAALEGDRSLQDFFRSLAMVPDLERIKAYPVTRIDRTTFTVIQLHFSTPVDDWALADKTVREESLWRLAELALAAEA